MRKAALALCILLLGGCTEMRTTASVRCTGDWAKSPLCAEAVARTRPLDACALVNEPTDYQASIDVREQYKNQAHDKSVVMTRKCERKP